MELYQESLSAKLELETRFMRLANATCDLLSQEGVRFRSYLPGLPYFTLLSQEQKERVVKAMQFQYDLYMEHVAEGYKLKDSPSLTWRALRKFGYVPTSDLFEKIRDHHVIEVYSSESVQIFRNLNFFQYCSYTFEEIHSLEWFNLFERPVTISSQILEATKKLFTGERRDNFDPQVPMHIVRETQSIDLLQMEFKVDILGPLFENRRPSAIISLETVNLINPPTC